MLLSRPPEQLTYRPDIDGLRALAVILVILFHAFPDTFHGGFIGVDVFFVISGYLISSIILRSLKEENFSLTEFYARRIRRIFPALALILTFSIFAGWYLLLPDELTRLGVHIAGGAGSIANLLFWQESGYFDQDAYTKPLLHLWSLGIEEQFYLIWPLLLAYAWRIRVNMPAVAAFGTASFLACLLITKSDPTAAFYAPWTRGWELMMGSLLAHAHAQGLSQNHIAGKNALATIGTGLILTAACFLDKTSLFPGWAALLPAFGAFLLICAGPNTWLAQKFMSRRPMTLIGKISYPLYLWHWPLLSLAWIARGKMPTTTARAALVLISFFLAYLTYRFLEKPCRAGSARTAVKLGSLMIGLSLGGILLYLGIPSPRNNNPELKPILEARRDWEFPLGFSSKVLLGTPVHFKQAGAGNVLFIGDSHMEQYGPRISSVLEKAPREYRSATFLTNSGCIPVPGSVQKNARLADASCKQIRDQVGRLAFAKEFDSVVIAAAWNMHYVTRNIEFGSKNALDAELLNLEKFVTTLASQKKVFFILDNPNGTAFEPRNFVSGSRLTSLQVQKFQKMVPLPQAQDQMNARLKMIATRAGGIVIDPTSHLCARNLCPAMTVDGKPTYKDDHHLRPFYVREHAAFIDATVEP